MIFNKGGAVREAPRLLIAQPPAESNGVIALPGAGRSY
jgi:hypothetical protein